MLVGSDFYASLCLTAHSPFYSFFFNNKIYKNINVLRYKMKRNIWPDYKHCTCALVMISIQLFRFYILSFCTIFFPPEVNVWIVLFLSIFILSIYWFFFSSHFQSCLCHSTFFSSLSLMALVIIWKIIRKMLVASILCISYSFSQFILKLKKQQTSCVFFPSISA